jgi:hypothetical protein
MKVLLLTAGKQKAEAPRGSASGAGYEELTPLSPSGRLKAARILISDV